MFRHGYNYQIYRRKRGGAVFKQQTLCKQYNQIYLRRCGGATILMVTAGFSPANMNVCPNAVWWNHTPLCYICWRHPLIFAIIVVSSCYLPNIKECGAATHFIDGLSTPHDWSPNLYTHLSQPQVIQYITCTFLKKSVPLCHVTQMYLTVSAMTAG